MREKLEAVTDTHVKAKGRITRPTALLVDKSASMHDAIELGKRIGAMISTVCESELFVYAFDTMAYEIARQGEDLAAWEKAFRGVTAGGATSAGAAVAWMAKKRQKVEQFIAIAQAMSPESKRNSRFLARLQMALDPGLGRVPLDGRPPPEAYADPNLRNRPSGFIVPIRSLVPSMGAGFVVALCGEMQRMPGLGKTPAFQKMDIDEHGNTYGLF